MNEPASKCRPSPFEAARSALPIKTAMQDSVDWSLEMIGVARRRDRVSFMRIYDHFMPRMVMYLKGLGSAEATAEDLTQEALLRVWQHAQRFDPQRGALSTWLFRIARNLYIDRERREPHWSATQDEIGRLMDEDALLDSAPTEALARYANLRHAIDNLPALQARLIRMSYYEGKSHGQIARELSTPLGTIKSGLRRAFLKLQSAMGETS